MAKMFYTLDEAADRLGKSADDVRGMAERNEIDEYRDGEKLMYKVDQIDLLSPNDTSTDEADLSGMISLTDSAEGTGLGLEETGGGMLGLTDSSAGGSDNADMPGDSGGITVLDDEVGSVDASADTLVTDEPGLDNVNLESFGSGSGLMDLTRESDDTSLGAEGLLDELYSGGDAGSSETATADGSDLFEGAAAAEDFSSGAADAATPVAVAAVAVDGKGSGLVGGLAFGMIIALLGAVAFAISAQLGVVPAFTEQLNIADQGMLIPVAALLGVCLVFGAIGFVFGGKN